MKGSEVEAQGLRVPGGSVESRVPEWEEKVGHQTQDGSRDGLPKP